MAWSNTKKSKPRQLCQSTLQRDATNLINCSSANIKISLWSAGQGLLCQHTSLTLITRQQQQQTTIRTHAR
jgi:hypothetical protein